MKKIAQNGSDENLYAQFLGRLERADAVHAINCLLSFAFAISQAQNI